MKQKRPNLSPPGETQFTAAAMKAAFALTSTERFEWLKGRAAAVQRIEAATDAFAQAHSVHIREFTADNAPSLRRDHQFSYVDGTQSLGVEISVPGSRLFTAVLCRRIIAIGITAPCGVGAGTEVRTIEVEPDCRRRSGLRRAVTIGRERFTVGVAHVLVRAILQQAEAPITTDATKDESQYVFTSLGFVGHSSHNPCILRFPA